MPLKLFCLLALCLCAVNANAQYRNGVDLISLHYDHAPDRDDGHATVAGLVVTRHFGIAPLVISGAYGDNNKSMYVSEAEQVMQITWGDQWLNAHTDWNGTIAITTARWLDIINKGGDIYVAEGGQSDFTAGVVKNIQEQTSVDTSRRINVIQHSLVNEKYANQSDLKFVKANTNYIKIDDGNSENKTADLHQPSSSFVSKARASYFSEQWNAAFDYLSPQRKLDFSDTVELLYILDIGKNQIADPDDFADVFITPDAPPPLANEDADTADTADTENTDKTEDTDKEESSNTPGSADGGQQSPEFPTCSADITDPDGDGYSWENEQSCVMPADADNNQPSTTINTPSFPGCSDGVLDTDGDGYGWENNQSCKVNGAAGGNNGNSVSALVFPACGDAAMDEDGDGFGWENQATCTVTHAQADTSNDDTGNNNSSNNSTFPTCSPEIIDDNGDGYGWENYGSCLISANDADTKPQQEPQASNPQQPVMLVNLLVCSENTVDEDEDGYSFENGMSCIMKSAHSSVTALISFPKCSTSVQDTDEDGYGWENGASCVFTSLENAVSNQPDKNVTIITFPSCSASVLDSDGDGYGWENNQTCTMPGGINNTAGNSNTVTGYLFPTCTTETDDNGNGYGWENNTTCIYPDSFPDPALLQPIVACSSGVVDFDNDGYGWESGKSCVFR